MGKPAVRSPRWAFMAKMMIRCQGGEDYLFRRRLIQTPWFGIYVHDIFEPDTDPDPHNHPWPFISIVLRGQYTERVHNYPEACPYDYIEQTHKRFSAHRMGTLSAHRIVEAAPGLKTLILVGRRTSRGWGWFVNGEYVDWEEYEKLHPSRAAK